jgi:hypothetical protein
LPEFRHAAHATVPHGCLKLCGRASPRPGERLVDDLVAEPLPSLRPLWCSKLSRWADRVHSRVGTSLSMLPGAVSEMPSPSCLLW